MRVTTGNGPGCRGELDALLEPGGAAARARGRSPRQNGKVDRMNRTLAEERQCIRAYWGEAERAVALRPSSSAKIRAPAQRLRSPPPMPRTPGVNSLLAHNI